MTPITDPAEAAIRAAGREIERHIAAGDRPAAVEAQKRMYALIREHAQIRLDKDSQPLQNHETL